MWRILTRSVEVRCHLPPSRVFHHLLPRPWAMAIRLWYSLELGSLEGGSPGQMASGLGGSQHTHLPVGTAWDMAIRIWYSFQVPGLSVTWSDWVDHTESLRRLEKVCAPAPPDPPMSRSDRPLARTPSIDFLAQQLYVPVRKKGEACRVLLNFRQQFF